MILDLIKGKGTTFEVRLPITKKVVNENEKKDKVENKNLQLVGLIIDDKPGIRDYLTILLSQFGVDVDAVETAEDGYELFKKNQDKYNFIISDVKMPGMSGIELLTKLRNEFPNNYPSSFLLPLSIDNLAY